MSYSLLQNQKSMTLDVRRNSAYERAMKKVITPDSVVLDLGSGLGIHGLLAAQMGAKRVYLVEPEDVIHISEEIAQLNGLSDRVFCLQGKIEEVELPEKVDIITSVFTGNFLLEEDLLPSLFYARDKYLKSGGHLIPDAATMEAVPVFAPEIFSDEIEAWSQNSHGVDYGPARFYAGQSIYYYRNEIKDARYIAEPNTLMSLDFYQANDTNCNVRASYSITENTLCHGIAGWFSMKLGDHWLSTAPHEPPLHWGSAFLPLDPSIHCTEKEVIELSIQRPVGGDWTWQVKTACDKQRRSTFLGQPMTPKTLQKLSAHYCPTINTEGQAAQYVLSKFGGSYSSSCIGDDLMAQFPVLFKSQNDAYNFVRKLVASYG